VSDTYVPLAEDEDTRLVNNILSSTADDNLLSWRYRTLARMNPYMASNPAALVSMASLSMSNEDLFTNAGAIYGMQKANDLAKRLPSYQPSTQRAIFSQLSPQQQSSLASMGYTVPAADVYSKDWIDTFMGGALTPVRLATQGLGKLVGPILEPVLDATMAISNTPMAAYRTIRQLDTPEQWLAAAGAAAGLVAGVALIPITGGASGTLAAMGIAGMSAITGATVTSFAASTLLNGSPNRWINAWGNAWNGERLFTKGATNQAARLLENGDLLALAQEVAVDLDNRDLLSIAKDIAGVRDAQRQDVQIQQLQKIASKYGEPQSVEFAKAYQALKDLFLQPAFKDAVSVLANGKISIGRDVMRAVNALPGIDMDANNGMGRWLSGGVDAASMFFLDPLMFAGGLANKYKIVKYGLNFADAGVAVRFRQIAELPKVARKMDLVADAVRTGRVELLDRGASEYRAVYSDLRAHFDELVARGTNTPDQFVGSDVVEWIAGHNQMKSIMSGIGIVHGTNYGVVKGIGRSQYAFRLASQPVREFLNGINDVRVESLLKKLVDHPELGPKLLDHLHGVDENVVARLAPIVGDERVARVLARMSMNVPVQEILGTTDEAISFSRLFGQEAGQAKAMISALSKDDYGAYRLGRIIGNIPVVRTPLRGLGAFVSGVTTQIPSGAIVLVNENGKNFVDDISKFVDLFQSYVPTYVRENWKRSIINAPTGAARLQGSLALIDSLASATGMRLSEEGNDLLNKFLNKFANIYGFGPTARIVPGFDPNIELAAGTLPINHMATMLPIPDLKEIRMAIRQNKLLEFVIGANPHISAFQNRFWKPSVLLRLGFIFRNAGEEMLGFATRYGFGSMIQEFTARGKAQATLFEKVKTGRVNQQLLDEALLNTANIRLTSSGAITEMDRWIQRSRWDIPAVMRPVARSLDWMGRSGRPFMQTVARYGEWLNDLTVRRLNDVRAHFHVGFGFAEGLKKYTEIADPTNFKMLEAGADWATAKNNIQNWARAVAFGNERSLRRMIIGGVDSNLVKHAEQFEGRFLKSIMEQVGTSNLAPWQRMNSGQNYVETLVAGPNGEEVVLVQDLGAREFGTRDNPSPLTQPWALAVLQRRAELFDDPIAASALDVVGRILTSDLQATLPPEKLRQVVVGFGGLLGSYDGVLDREMFQLYLTVTNSRFDRAKFDAVLNNMRRETATILEEYPNDSLLKVWAESRNELADALRAAFPGNSKPTWKQIVNLVSDEEQNPMLRAAWSKYNNSVNTTVSGIGFKKINNQSQFFASLDDLLGADVSPATRDWVNRLLLQMYDKPNLVDFSKVVKWKPELGFAGSGFYGSYTEAESDIRIAVRAAYEQFMNDPQFADTLNLNARWASSVDSRALYVIDPEILAARFDELDPLWRVASLDTTPVTKRFNLLGSEGGGDSVANQALRESVRAALAANKPLIFTDIDSAQTVLRVLDPSLPASSVKQTWVTNPIDSLEGNTPDGLGRLLARQIGAPANTFKFNALTPNVAGADQIENFGMLNYFVDDLTPDVLSAFHYDNFDSVDVNARIENIVDSVVEHVKQNTLAGRRAQFYVRDDANGQAVYRSVGGRAERLEPGEVISTNEPLFSSPKMGAEDRVKVGDQRFFFSATPTYDGSSEILWPILNPLMFDHAEANKGLVLFENKAPITASGKAMKLEDTDFRRIRYSHPDNVKFTPENDLPDYEILQVFKPVSQNMWDRIVQYGFGRVIGPWIDAIARKPIAFHAFALAADRNTANINWLIRSSTRQENLRKLGDALISSETFGGPASRFVDMYGELGRLVGRAHADINAGTWSNVEAIAYLRGALAEDPQLLGDIVRTWSTRGSAYYEQTKMLSKSANTTLRAAAEDLIDNLERLDFNLVSGSTDELMNTIDRIFGPGSSLQGSAAGFDEEARRLPTILMTDEQRKLDKILNQKFATVQGEQKRGWEILKDAATQRANTEADIYKYAAEHAIRDLMPFIDSHEIRSQFADSVSGLLPFWYAEENFLKRWAKMFAEGGPAMTLARIRKLQASYFGLRTMGIIRQDPQGKQYFVWPGSEIMTESLQKVFGVDLPLNTVFQSPVDRIIPGFTPAFGTPATGPFVSIPLDLVGTIFPEAVPIERAIVGDFSAGQSVLEHVVPAQIRNTWSAVAGFGNDSLDGSSERHAAAMMTAIAQLEFTPYALKDDATPGERDEYLRRVRDHARVILLAQALGGWFMPAQLSPLTTANASSLSWLTSGQIDDPQQVFSSEYYNLIENLGIEEGTIAFIELNADANLQNVLAPLAATVSRTETPSGAPLPKTEEGILFYINNQELLNQYPEAGPWLLPQDEANSKRSQYAYDTQMITGLRDRRTPGEFLDAMKYKEGAAVYFDSRQRYEQEFLRLKNGGNDEVARQLTNAWENWSALWRASHPIFAEQLVSSDARERRNRIITQMRYLLNDPEAPQASHFTALKTLQDTFDAFMTARSYLALDRTSLGENKLALAKQQFSNWASNFIRENPLVQSYWLTVLSPEAGVD
jgi:hypothetical protein